MLGFRGLKDYLDQSWQTRPPSVTPSSAWILRHEYHLQYFVLMLARRMVLLLVLSFHSPEESTSPWSLQLSVSDWQLVFASMFFLIFDLGLVTLQLSFNAPLANNIFTVTGVGI